MTTPSKRSLEEARKVMEKSSVHSNYVALEKNIAALLDAKVRECVEIVKGYELRIKDRYDVAESIAQKIEKELL